jgi:pyruvyltransferase
MLRVQPPRIFAKFIAQYWFRPYANVGDQLAPEITRRALGLTPIWVRRSFRGKLVGLGSILGAVAEEDLVVGTGAISGRDISLPRSVEVLCVRGPLTRALFGDRRVPEVYGDPGLLTAELFPEISPGSRLSAKIGCVPHHADTRCKQQAQSARDVHVLDVRTPPRGFLQSMVECSVILSSSLHGIILAESFGIPALWISPSEEIAGGCFKFHDYYLGTEREPERPLSFEEALEQARGGNVAVQHVDKSPIRSAFSKAREILNQS